MTPMSWFKFRLFVKSRKGLSLVEYALVGALVSVAAISALTTLGTEVTNTLSGIASQLSTVSSNLP